MGKLVEKLNFDLHGINPFEGFEWESYPDDMTGGDDHPIFDFVIKSVQPRLLVEVGSWKGRSAVRFADLMKKYEIEDAAIVCVDTWLGSDTVHTFTHRDHPIWGMKQLFSHGYSTMYWQFLANVARHGHTDIIVPFPNTSSVAGRWFKQQKDLSIDVAYIDGSHVEEECYADLCAFWPLVTPGGIMFGDDFEARFYQVIAAVYRFCKERDLTLQFAEGCKWLIQKTV